MSEDDVESPSDEDFVMYPCGRLYSQTCVGVEGGKYLGTFDDDESAESAICERMQLDNFYPDVWELNDRGQIIGRRILKCG